MKALLKSSAFKITMTLIIVVICVGAYVLLFAPKQQVNNSKSNNEANNPSSSSNGGMYIAPGGEGIQAVYLAPKNGGVLSDNDLKTYPQILKVTDFEALTTYTNRYIIPIWIDKDAIDMLPQGWINESPEKFYPIIVVGYGDALYAMRDKLGLMIYGPWVDWSKRTIEPGFSV
ncbi:MAG: hypothetical protein ACPLYF_03970 [Fervidobacterium sp.]